MHMRRVSAYEYAPMVRSDQWMNEDMYISKEVHAHIHAGTCFLGESFNIDGNAVQ